MLSRFVSSMTRRGSSASRSRRNSFDCQQSTRADARSQRLQTRQMNSRRMQLACGSDSEEEPRSWDFADDDEVVVAVHADATMSQPEPEVSSNGALAVSTRVEYTSLPQGRSQNVFGLVTLQAAAPAPEAQERASAARQPVDLVAVLDVSGSMQGEKIRLVQDAVRFVVSELRPEDRLSLVAFNHSTSRVLRLRRMDAQGKDDAIQQTLSLAAGGGTEIALGLEQGLAIMEKRRQRNGVSAVLLLTDGQDSSSYSRFPSLVDRASAAGVSIYTFGFGADHDAALLSNLAEQAHTPFSYVEDVDSIRNHFAGAVGGLVSVAAQRIEVTLDCSCLLKKAHTPFRVDRASDSRLTVQIPDMLAGERRDVLVELSVPAETSAQGAEEQTLLQATARYWDLDRSIVVQTPVAVMMAQRLKPDEAEPELEPDLEVSAQRCRIEATEALSLAREHGVAGRFKEAQDVLSEGRRKLASGPKTEMASSMGLELQAAEERLRDRAAWEDGGRAELEDMCAMNVYQRCNHMSQKTKSSVRRTSMGMYTNSVQKSWCSRSG